MSVKLSESAKVAAIATLPDCMVEGLFLYIEKRLPPGPFMTSVLSNDLSGACLHADDMNKRYLYAYVYWLYNNAPIGCWGSSEQVAGWLSGYGKTTDDKTIN